MMKSFRTFPLALLFLVLTLSAGAGCSDEADCSGSECVVITDDGTGGKPQPPLADCQAACNVMTGTCPVTKQEAEENQADCIRGCQDGLFSNNELDCLIKLPCGEDPDVCYDDVVSP